MVTECHSLNVGLHIDTEVGAAYGLLTMTPSPDDPDSYVIKMPLADMRQVMMAIMMAGAQLEKIETELDGLEEDKRQQVAMDISARYSADFN
jgi:hypothetical protein